MRRPVQRRGQRLVRQEEGGGLGLGVDWVLQACQVHASMLVGSILRPPSTGDIVVLFAGACVMGTVPALKNRRCPARPCSAQDCDLAMLVSMWGLRSFSPPVPCPSPSPSTPLHPANFSISNPDKLGGSRSRVQNMELPSQSTTLAVVELLLEQFQPASAHRSWNQL